MRASLASARSIPPEFPAPPRPARLAAARAPLVCALFGLAAAAVPGIGRAEITLEVVAGSDIAVGANERIKVRDDGTLPDFASTSHPPLRVTSAAYSTQNLIITGDLCVTMPFFGEGPQYGQVLTLGLADDEGATATLTLVARPDGGASEGDCRDPAQPVQGPGYPFIANMQEDGNLLLPTASLLAVARDPNGGTVSWSTPGLQPPELGTVQLEGSPGAPTGIRFVPVPNFSGSVQVTYEVNDTNGDGPVQFAAIVNVQPVNDPPTAIDSSCSVGAAGGPCLLHFGDIDTANVSFSILTQPQGGALGNIVMSTRQIVYTPRPGTATDFFTYQVSDGEHTPETAIVSITMTEVAQAPTAAIRLTRTDGTPISTPSNIPDTDAAAGETVRLDGTGSLPGNPSSPIGAYHWTVNNQALAEQTATVDVRLPDGPSTITLVVEDQLERSSAVATQQATVAAQTSVPPAAVIRLTRTDGTPISAPSNIPDTDAAAGELVRLDGTDSLPGTPSSPIVAYHWTVNNQALAQQTATVDVRLPDGPSTITLVVGDQLERSSAATQQATVAEQPGVPPAAVIRLTRTDGTPISTPSNIPDTDAAVGEAVRLDGTGSLPGTPSSPIAAYHWTLNDQVLPQQTATVDVRLPDGPSTITLVVDDQLERSSASATQQATVAQPNAPGTAVISLNGTPVTGGAVSVANADFAPGETVVFDASQSSDPDGDTIVLYTWRLNGAQVQSSASATATLALNEGGNTIALTVTDSRGGTGSTTITANVTADTNLGALPGLSGNERSVGRALDELCAAMRQLPSESLTTGQRDLLNRCSGILNDDDPNAQRDAVVAITPDAITSQQTTAIDFSTSQLGNLTSRLVALREGAGGGLSTAGLSIRDAQGRPIPFEQLAALGRHLAGGGSGDEDEASLASRWGIFLNGNVIDGEKDETDNEAAFDFGGWGITAGFDYRFTDRFVLGLSLGYNESDSDFAGSRGSLDSEGVSTSIYGTYFNDRWYADFIGSSGALDYESARNIVYTDQSGPVQAVASGTTGGDLSTLGVSFGYDFNKGGWTFGPTAALTSVEVEVDAFAERTSAGAGGLNMAFGDQRAQSRTAQGGFQVAYAVSREWGVLAPQMRLSFVKEFENDSEIVNVRFVNDPFANNPTQPSPGAITILTDDPDQEYLRWAFGVSFVRTNGFSAFVDYEALAGMSTVSSGELTFGLRFERSFE